MNLINSIKEKIKVMLESTVDTSTTDNTTEVKFIDAKTSDGKILRSEGESFVVGAKVSYMNEDGTLSDVEDAVYTLEDGSTLTTVGSVITEVTEASSDTTEAAKAANEVEANSTVELSKQINDVAELISSLTDEMVNLKKEISTLKTEKVEMKKQIEKIADEPATDQRKKTDKNVELKKELRPSEIISQLRGI